MAWQRWWATAMATAMADGDRDSNDRWQGRRQQWWLTATQQRLWWQCLTVTATAMADGSGDGNGRLQQRQQQQRRRSWRQRWWRQWQWWWPRQGQPLQRKGCLFMWWQCAALWQVRHLASTPMDTRKVHSPALHHGGDTAKSVCSPSRGGFLIAHHRLFFVYFLQLLLVYWTTLWLPPALFRRSETLSGHWCSTSSTPPRTLSVYWQSTLAPIALFVKVSLGRACNDYNHNFFCVGVKWQISQQPSLFPKISPWHWQITPLSFWKHPVVIVETFKVKV